MNITAVKRLKIAIVPSWLSELVTLSTDLCYEDLLSYSKLVDEKSSIVSEEQVIIYALTQSYLTAFTDRAFMDIPLVGSTDENAIFMKAREIKVENVNVMALAQEASNKGQENELSFNPVGIGAKEYYMPLLINSDTLLLIGSITPVYKDARAFFNAVLETVGDKLDFTEFKQYQFFKHYLRHAVTG